MSFATASCDLWQNEQRSDSSEPRDVFIVATTPGHKPSQRELVKSTPEPRSFSLHGSHRDTPFWAHTFVLSAVSRMVRSMIWPHPMHKVRGMKGDTAGLANWAMTS